MLTPIKALESRPNLTYLGVYDGGRIYVPGECVTWDGGMCVCRERTAVRPAYDGQATRVWTLAVKRGRDGRS